MTRVAVSPLGTVRARLRVPGDKSIAHRALLLNAAAEGEAVVTGLPDGADVASTVSALIALGVRIDRPEPSVARVVGGGRWSSTTAIDCGNSGTTARLLLGLLAPRARAPVTLIGDASLARRPMARVVEPLSRMGARLEGRGTLPITVAPAELRGMRHELRVASAQVKSALLLAGLRAAGPTIVAEPGRSRDHTERLLAAMGARITLRGGAVTIEPGALTSRDVTIPGDLSSAAPFLALAACRPGSEVVVERVGVNPTRTGFLDLLDAFGAEVEVRVEQEEPEPVGTVRVTGGALRGIEVDPGIVPRAIDELPLVAVVATQATGTTTVRGAAELRVKESDRIASIARGLETMGAQLEVAPDGFTVRGPTALEGRDHEIAGDHRIGMALAIAASLATGPSRVDGAEWVDVSYPGFFADLETCARSAVEA